MSAQDTLSNKTVVVCGLLQDKTCYCQQCKKSGACSNLPNALCDLILQKFEHQLKSERLEKLGTYALDFGDQKIVRNGEDTVFVRPVDISGELFSVAYKLRIVRRVSVENCGDALRTNSGGDSRREVMRQMSQG